MQSKEDIMSEKILSLVDARSTVDAAQHGLSVDLIADFVCPWSYIGQQRLRNALSAVQGPSRCTWFPFQLNPDMPVEGQAFDEYLEKKFGDREMLAPAMEQLETVAHQEGLSLNFSRIERVPNTVSAHCLMRQSAVIDQQDELAKALYNAYFGFGEDIGSRELLESIGLQLGFGSKLVRDAFDDKALRDAVLSEETNARRAGVVGVPNFLINRRVFVVGAQDSKQLLGAIDRALFGDAEQEGPKPTVH